jgi:peptidoglycan/xylan/chitin deacetylase (PgdA/CDA1 family)
MNPFRLDRFLTLKIFSPLQQLVERTEISVIPILMYHSISNKKNTKKHPYYETHTSPDVFSDHMKFLFLNNFQIISLTDVCEILLKKNVESQKNPYNKSIEQTTNRQKKIAAITFDDGFQDFYTDAFPILHKYGFSATVFLSTGYIGQRFKGKPCMSWDQVRELQKSGVNFGSHTVNHPELYQFNSSQIEYELKNSKERIDNELLDSIDSFSYPFAFPDHDEKFKILFEKLLIKCGYKYGVTTRVGTASNFDNLLFLKRIPVNFWDDHDLFKVKLEGAYDWIYNFQLLSKKLKRRFFR